MTERSEDIVRDENLIWKKKKPSNEEMMVY
jgi:hypothetical protein